MSYKLIVYTRTEGNQQICLGIQIELHNQLHFTCNYSYITNFNTLELRLSRTSKDAIALHLLHHVKNKPVHTTELDLNPVFEDINVSGTSYISFSHPLLSSIKF